MIEGITFAYFALEEEPRMQPNVPRHENHPHEPMQPQMPANTIAPQDMHKPEKPKKATFDAEVKSVAEFKDWLLNNTNFLNSEELKNQNER